MAIRVPIVPGELPYTGIVRYLVVFLTLYVVRVGKHLLLARRRFVAPWREQCNRHAWPEGAPYVFTTSNERYPQAVSRLVAFRPSH